MFEQMNTQPESAEPGEEWDVITVEEDDIQVLRVTEATDGGTKPKYNRPGGALGQRAREIGFSALVGLPEIAG